MALYGGFIITHISHSVAFIILKFNQGHQQRERRNGLEARVKRDCSVELSVFGSIPDVLEKVYLEVGFEG